VHIDHTGPVKLVGGRIGEKSHAVRPTLDGGTAVEELGVADRSEPVLLKPQLEELTRVVRRIQDTLGEGHQPQDVEWCHDGWYLTVTQARPITAPPEATFAELAGQPTIWSNANLKDATPGVQSPLGWWFHSLTVEVLLRQIFWRGGYDFPEGLTWSRLVNGRVYVNLSALQWAAFDAFGWQPADTNRGGVEPSRPHCWPGRGRSPAQSRATASWPLPGRLWRSHSPRRTLRPDCAAPRTGRHPCAAPARAKCWRPLQGVRAPRHL